MKSDIILNHSDSQVNNQLSLPLEFGRGRQKPQISTIPGTHQRERHRYRVTVGNEILGDYLTIDEALALANGGES